MTWRRRIVCFMIGVTLSVLMCVVAGFGSPPPARVCQTPTYLLGNASAFYVTAHPTYRCGG